MAQSSDSRAAIDAAMTEAAEHVARMPKSPGARELGARLERFRAVMKRWETIPPDAEQVEALRAWVAEVTNLARTTSPTRRYRPPTA